MTFSHAKDQGQWSVGFEDEVETNGRTDGQTDGGDCITRRTNSVGNESVKGRMTELLCEQCCPATPDGHKQVYVLCTLTHWPPRSHGFG